MSQEQTPTQPQEKEEVTAVTQPVASVKAFGFKWTFSENDLLADFQRADLERQVARYVMALKKPASQSAAFILLDQYYPDIVSAVAQIEGEGGPALVDELLQLTGPAKWVEVAGQAWKEGRDGEVLALWNAAKGCNPHWYPEPALADAPENVAQAQTELDEAKKVLNVEAKSDAKVEHPDSNTAMKNAATVMKHSEGRAKKKA